MEKKNNAKLKALMELRKMVENLVNEEFKSTKMPKLMAVKVTKVEPKKLDAEVPEALEAVDELLPEMPSAESCPVCEMADCECDSEESAELDNVSRLKKLLKK